LPDAWPRSRQSRADRWWADVQNRMVAEVSSAAAMVQSMTGRAPVGAFMSSNAAFLPQLPFALATAGMPVLLGAPFGGRTPGTLLTCGGCQLAHRNVNAVEILEERRGRQSLDQRIRNLLDAAPDDGVCLVGIDLSRLTEKRMMTTFAKWLAQFAKSNRDRITVDIPLPAGVSAAVGRDAVLALAGEVTRRLHPVCLNDTWLSVAELFSLLVQLGAHMDGDLPDIELRPLAWRGPLADVSGLDSVVASRSDLAIACRQVRQYSTENWHVAAAVEVGGFTVSPSAFMYGVARALAKEQAQTKIPSGALPILDASRQDVQDAAEAHALRQPDANRRRLVRTGVLQEMWTAK
jgi:hypothetical protein